MSCLKAHGLREACGFIVDLGEVEAYFKGRWGLIDENSGLEKA